MADFVQTMKDWKRMCNAMGEGGEYSACERCNLKDFGCPAIYENECNNTDWDHVEKVVTAWAAEHPKKVYPTWLEWLNTQAVVANVSIGNYVLAYDKINKPIHADLAEKLGLQPKEG